MIVRASLSHNYSIFLFFLHCVYLIEANRIYRIIYSEILVFFSFLKASTNLQFNLAMQFIPLEFFFFNRENFLNRNNREIHY